MKLCLKWHNSSLLYIWSSDQIEELKMLCQLTAHVLHEKLKAREITAVELTESIYARIAEVEPHVKGYLTLTKDLALAQAGRADDGFQKGDDMPASGWHPDRN